MSGFVNAQIVNIPDANLKSKLLQASPTYYIAKNLSGNFFTIDANADGEIQISEALQVSYLYLREMNISNTTGIESFSNVTELILEKNSISSLNTNTLTNLTILRIGENNLSSLNLSPLVNLTQLNCDNNQLSSLNISTLTNLVIFNCSNNLLTSLNTTGLTNLSQLSCNDNSISSLDLSTNNALTVLLVYNNQLSTLNVSNLTSIIDISCYGNLFTSLNFNNLTTLKYLYCGNSQLTTFNHSNLPNLESLSIGGIGISTLDVSSHTTLKLLGVGGTSISTINLSTLGILETLDISDNPNITELDLSGNVNLYGVRIHSNNALTFINLKNGKVQNIDALFYDTSLPSLQFICGDDAELAILTSEVNYFYANYEVSVNTYCSFIPGGNYNTITGHLTFDSNNNGCDALDVAPNNLKLLINSGSQQGATFANTAGNYNFFTQAGNFTVTPSFENPAWYLSSPASVIIPFANNNNNTVTQNFCITANGVHPDLEIVIAPIVPARPGFDAVYQIVYKNKGNQTLSQLYGVNFFFNQNLMDFVSATTTPSTVGPGSLSWSYTNLLPFESRSIYVTLNINTPTDTANPVNIGDVLQFTTSILPMTGDETTVDNTYLFNQTVVGSFDPNNIICMEGTVVSPSEIGDYLHYIINFENTGTYEAENIVVKTEVNVADFDLNSLQMLATSHNAYVRVVGNKVEFILENIMLDTGGHGNVLLKIRSKSNLVTGDVVSKKADIFFDYNYPIDTGMANTTFQALSTGEFVTDNLINVYPNPAVNFVTINSDTTINSIQLYDVQGRLLQTKIENQTEVTFDISNQSSGIYFFKIQSDNGVKVVKLIKE